MSVSGGEVETVLTARDNASAVVANYATNVKAATEAVEGASKSTTSWQTEMSRMDAVATRMIERLTILYALRGAATFIEGLFTSADELVHLSEEFDTSIGTMERWQQATKQSGESINIMTSASDTLTKKLSKGDKGLGEALDQLGISWQTLWSNDAGGRMDVLAVAVSNVTDKIVRSGLEFQIWGTDKIDPVLTRLKDVAATIDDDDVKALAQAKESLEITGNAVTALSARLLVGAQNWVAYWAASQHTSTAQVILGAIFNNGPMYPNQENSAADDQKLLDANIASMGAKAAKGTRGAEGNLVTASPGMNLPTIPTMGPKEEAAAARELTDQVRILMTAEREQAALEREMSRARLADNKEIQKEMATTSKMWLSETNDMVMAELAARTAVNAAKGFDVNGIPLGQANDPRNVAQRSMLDLQGQKDRNPGIDTSAREQQIRDTMNAALDAEVQKVNASALAFDNTNRANKALGLAMDEAAKSLSAMKSAVAPTADSLTAAGIFQSTISAGLTPGLSLSGIAPKPIQTHADGGPANAGLSMLHDGEYVVPAAGALVKSGGGGAVTVNMSVNGILDPATQRQLADMVGKSIMSTAFQGRKYSAA